jgi:hypothetical protein
VRLSRSLALSLFISFSFVSVCLYISVVFLSLSVHFLNIKFFGIVRGGVQLGPLGTMATNRPTVAAPGDYGDGEIGGKIGRGNQSTRRKPYNVYVSLSRV